MTLIKKIKHSHVKRTIIVIGVIIIPLLYSYFYLGAFWDPYSRLDKMPVAVVNQDKGADIDNRQRNLGTELCDELKDDGSLKFTFTSAKDAKDGTIDKKYYATITIPSDFSADIASAADTTKHTATITYSANEKRNYLASQILNRAVLEMEEKVRGNVNEELTAQLSDKLTSVPHELSKLSDGFTKLYDGSKALNNGAIDLNNGTDTFSHKFTEYKNGVSTLKGGAKDLNSGIASLDSGITKLLNGMNTLNASAKDITRLSDGASTLASGAKQFNASLTMYTDGVNELVSNVESTSAFLTQYATQINPAIMNDPYFAAFMSQLSKPQNAQDLQTLKSATAQLKTASSQIASGASQLSDGTKDLPELKTALSQLQQGLKSAKSGSSQLLDGSRTLYNGVSTVSSATNQLSAAANDIHAGTSKLKDGSTDLKNGIQTAQNGVDDSISDANEQVKSLSGLSDFAKAPVSVEQKNVTSVPNYGTAFAPYFMSLSLWVGGLIIFFGIYLDADKRFRILGRESANKMARSFIYLGIGFAQAIVLGIVITAGLGLKVKNPMLYYLSCCLISMVFISIIQFLMVNAKDFGKFLVIALLILQLTSCGGTFPMETLSKFFNVLYPFMPMTYSVGLLKETISGADTHLMLYNAGILFAILFVFMVLTVLCSLSRKKKAKKERHRQHLHNQSHPAKPFANETI